MKTFLIFLLSFVVSTLEAGSYAILVSEETLADPDWKNVVTTLQKKHQAEIIAFKNEIEETKPALEKLQPRFTCFVARIPEASKEHVTKMHLMCRSLDADAFTDTFWAILTGHSASEALLIAQEEKPLTIRKVASGMELALARCQEGVCFNELIPKGRTVKSSDGIEEKPTDSNDSTFDVVDAINDYQPDLIATSGHATERDWQLGFRYPNGSFQSKDGNLFGVNLQGKQKDVNSPNPKVYLPIGNCLMGHIDSKDAMAVAWMKKAGVRQMLGYTEPTWYGYMGWGVLDYFIEQPSRYSLTEAFFANHHALVDRLQTYFPEVLNAAPNLRPKVQFTEAVRNAGLNPMDAMGLHFGLFHVAFYGDPAWLAKMEKGPLAFQQNLSVTKEEIILTIEPNEGENSYEPVNTNGSQRGYRPFVAFLPDRLDPKNYELVEGADWKARLEDDFILIPHPPAKSKAAPIRIAWKLKSK